MTSDPILPSNADAPTLMGRIAELEQQLASTTRELQTFKALADAAPNGIVITRNTNVVYANEAYKLLSGYGDRVHGMSTSIMHAHEAEVFDQIVQSIQADHTWQGILTFPQAQGPTAVGQASVFGIKHNNQSIGVAAIITDITDQDRTRHALRENNDRLQAIISSMPMVLFELDPQGIFTRSEGKGLEALGLKAGQVVGLSVFDVYSTTPEILDDAKRALTGEHIHAFRNVGPFWFETWYVPIVHEDGSLRNIIGISIDMTSRITAEQEQQRLQQDMIEAQQAALRELSTPLIPLASNLVAMPLIGMIDSVRSQQVIETLLQGVSEMQANTAIIDITGVPLVDTQVANGLIRAAQAVKLLGARVILTGIRPEVAQTLVGLGVDLTGITTRSTLQSGIADALGSRQRA